MTLPALPSAATLTISQIAEAGQQIVEWSATVDDAAEVKEAANKWAAITEYLRRTSREGIAEAEAALRRLEMRVGELLGPAPGRGHPETHREEFHSQQATDFREMAANQQVVEDVIAGSDDTSPPSRRKVMAAIRADHAPEQSPPTEADRRQRLEVLAAKMAVAPVIAGGGRSLDWAGYRIRLEARGGDPDVPLVVEMIHRALRVEAKAFERALRTRRETVEPDTEPDAAEAQTADASTPATRPPWPGYDGAKETSIVMRIRNAATAAKVRHIIDWEHGHQRRPAVLQAGLDRLRELGS